MLTKLDAAINTGRTSAAQAGDRLVVLRNGSACTNQRVIVVYVAQVRPSVGLTWDQVGRVTAGGSAGLYVRVYYSISIEIVILSGAGRTLASEVEGSAFRRQKPTLE